MIDQEELKQNKRKEKTEIEPEKKEPCVILDEDGCEIRIVLEEEIDFGDLEESEKSKLKKRKPEEKAKKGNKKRKFELVAGWGSIDAGDILEKDGAEKDNDTESNVNGDNDKLAEKDIDSSVQTGWIESTANMRDLLEHAENDNTNTDARLTTKTNRGLALQQHNTPHGGVHDVGDQGWEGCAQGGDVPGGVGGENHGSSVASNNFKQDVPEQSEQVPGGSAVLQGDGVGRRAQGGDVLGERGKGANRRVKGGKVRMAVEALERNYSPIKKPRFVKPYGKRGIKKDGLVQMQIASLVGGGKSDNYIISGLVRAEGHRKGKSNINPIDVPGTSLARD